VTIEIRERRVSESTLSEYATIPIRFEVRSILDIGEEDLGATTLVERSVSEPWIKDYDEFPDARPTTWTDGFDLSNWGLLEAREGEILAGGAVLAWNTPGINMLRERDDLVVVWDIRVAPDHRGRGVGKALFAAVIAWAEARGCRDLEVETQNTNVPACRFYKAQGCTLGRISRDAYPECPDEVMLIWHHPLSG